MGIPDHLTCLLRNLHAGQEATVRTGHGTTDRKGCILSPCLFNFYAEYNMQNARLAKAQAGIKIAGRNVNSLRYADDTTLMAESEEELKSFWTRVKEESDNSTFKNKDHGILSHHFIANKWGNNGSSKRLYFLGLQNHCSHEIKRRLLLGRKSMANLDSILKSRDITLSAIVCIVEAMVFPVVMYECESWTIKKAELQRIDIFQLWCWRRLLRVSWAARRSNQ